MNQPKRWLDSASNPKIRDLLRSGLTDAPGAQALPRTAAALGLGTAVTVVSGSAAALALGSAAHGTFGSAAAGATAASATGAALATGSGSVGALLVGQWLAVGFLAGGVASAGLVAAQSEFGAGSNEARQVAPRVPAVKGTAVAARSRANANANANANPNPNPNAAAPSFDVSAPPSLPSPQRENEATPALGPEPGHANAHPPRAAVPAAIPASTALSAASREAAPGENEKRGALAAEIAWIDSARRALASGDVNRSLAALDAFERTRTLGVLDREAALLRVDALRKKGDLAAARRVAERYLGAFPGDAHGPRLREFLSGSEPKH